MTARVSDLEREDCAGRGKRGELNTPLVPTSQPTRKCMKNDLASSRPATILVFANAVR